MNGYQVLSSYEEDPLRPDEFGRQYGAWTYVVDHATEGVVFETQRPGEAHRRCAQLNAAAERVA